MTLVHSRLLFLRRSFILAGVDTTSNSLSRILHLLAQNPSVQEKLRAEIVEAQGGAGSDASTAIPYEDLNKLPYLDAVCRETLRIYAPVALAGRLYVYVYVLPATTPLPACTTHADRSAFVFLLQGC